jgi:hypothetical protein
MTTIKATTTAIETPRDDFVIDDAQLAAVAFLGRYSGRTLDAYRDDLRGFFQWASDNNLAVLAATRPHIELYEAGWKTGNWQRLRSTVGCRRCAASIASPTSMDESLEPRAVSPSAAGAPVDRATTRPLRSGRLPVRRAVRPRPRRPGGASRVERPASERGVRHQRRGLAIERGHRTLRILGKGNYPVVVATSAAAAQHYRARPAPRPGQDIATTRLRLRWCGSRAARRRASATPRPSAAQASRGGPATPRPSRVCRSRRSRRGRRGLGSAARGR